MTHTIKLTFTDGNEIITRINGTDEEISTYYGANNIMSHTAHQPQVKRIDYLESEYLNNRSSMVYLFIDYNQSGVLQ